MSDEALRRFLRQPKRSNAEGNGAAQAESQEAGFPSPPTSQNRPADVVAPVWVGPCLLLAGAAANPSLIFKQRGGELTALTYGYLSAARFNPAEGVEIDFVGAAVSIKGVRLGPVFEAIAGQRALMVAEAPGAFESDKKNPFVQTVAIVSTQER